MSKKFFGLAVLVILVGIAVANLLQDVRENEETEQAQKEFLSESDTAEQEGEGLKEGQIAPDFELKTLEGEAIKLSDYQGKKVILNFWATWCPPCKAEMPHMQNFYETKAKERNVEVVAVNLTSAERGGNVHEKVDKFIKEYGLTFTVPLDEEGEIGKTYEAFTIPTTYIVDSKGKIEKKIIGPMDEEMMEKLTSEID